MRRLALIVCASSSLITSAPVRAAWQNDDIVVEEIVATAVPPARLADLLARSYDKGFRDSLVPQLLPLEKQHPGLTAQVRDDAVTTLRKAMTAQTPTLFAALRAIYIRELSPSEIITLRDFYRSQAGRRMAEAAFTGASEQTFADLGRIDQAAGRQRTYDAAAKRMLEAVSNNDLPALSAFAQTSAASKLPALQPLQQEAGQRWIASIDARTRTEVQNAITASIRRYIAAHTASGSRSR